MRFLKVFRFPVAYNTDMFPAIFLDRDGVLIENRDDYVREWSHVTLLPNAIDALTGFHRAGFKIIIVTNQSAVGRGMMTFHEAQKINERLVKTIGEYGGWVDAVFMCPHKPEDTCICRKPQPGLLLQAAREFSIDLPASWMVGDAWTDILAGQAAGVEGSIIVRTGRGAAQLNQPQPSEIQPFHVCENILDAFHHVTLLRNNESAHG
jgi:D-glycero-D-manno-heptose 1,7-bisphosphate phosphatase